MSFVWPASGKHRLWLPVSSEAWLPVLAAFGREAGPALLLSAGLRGDEAEGIRTIYEIFEELDHENILGGVLAVPVMNPPAHRAGSRLGPADGKDLATVFPGQSDGTVTEQIAAMFATELLARASFYLELRGMSQLECVPLAVGFEAMDAASRAASECFGSPVIWTEPAIPPGHPGATARQLGIPFLFAEMPCGSTLRREELAGLKQGIRNVMLHLGLMEGKLPDPVEIRRLFGHRSPNSSILAERNGFFSCEVDVLDRVSAGQRLGRLLDLQGRVLSEYRAARAATIGMTRRMPAVEAGDTLFLLADER